MNCDDPQVMHHQTVDVANAWYEAIAHTSFTSYPAARVRQRLAELAEQAMALLFSESFDRAEAEAIGIELVALHYIQPEALGRTQEVLARQMTQGVAADQLAQLQLRLALLLGAVADGFFRAARDMILMEQEQIRNALVAEHRRMEEALLASEAAERESRALAEALRDTAAALNSTLDSDQVLDHILENVGCVLPHDAANIMLVDQQGAARVMRHRGYVERGLEEWLRNLSFSIASTPGLRQMADTRRPLIIPDTQDYAGWIDLPQTRWLRSYACAPICFKGALVGFLNLDSATPGFFCADHAERLQAFADQAAVAIENARLFETTRRSVERLTLLHEAGQALTQAESLASLYQEILRRAIQLVEAHASLLMLYDGADHLAIVAAENLSERIVGSRVMLGEGISGCAAQHREPQQARNYAEPDVRERILRTVDPSLVSIVALPLIWQDQLVGVLAIMDDREREFDADELHMLTLFSALVASALEQRRAVVEIQAREAEARALTVQVARAQEEERARIAGQLQDLSGHRILALQEKAESIRASLSPDDPLAGTAAESDVLLREARQSISSLAMDLDLKTLDTLGLGSATRQYIERVCASAACPVSLRISGREHRLPSEIEQLVFRGLQEILSSVLRHAQAAKVAVSLHIGVKSLRLNVQCNGCGFDRNALPAGMADSLANLRRQVEAASGAISLSGAPGKGTTIALHLLFRMPRPAQLQTPVMLIHSHEVIRHGIRLALAENSEFTCVGEAADGLSALHQVELCQPELVLMEVRLPGLSGIEVTRQIANRFPQVRVIVLSDIADETYLEQALQAGAKGFILVSDDNQQIIGALQNVRRGEMFVSPVMADAWSRWKARVIPSTPLDLLTSREREVLQLIVAGYSNRLIAEELGISARTVEVHRRNLKAKLKYKSSAQLIQFAIRFGLISLKV